MTLDLQLPRIVLVTRKTPLELLLERHGTMGQVRFYLESRGQEVSGYQEAHERFLAGLAEVQRAIPPDQRRVRVDRQDLDRFLFAPEDVVVIVGQDGLVPNAAKYLNGQLAIGVNPDPERYDGVLCPHGPGAVASLLEWLAERPERRGNRGFRVEHRVMALATREDGQRLLALNEVFIGHQTHQSARYRLQAGNDEERHSSSGVICSTGTGSTGWARSFCEQVGMAGRLPAPEEQRLAWFVREPFPSVYTQTGLRYGDLAAGEHLTLFSEMGEGGVIFADGIEPDRLEFLTGQRVTVEIAANTLNLVTHGSLGAPALPGTEVGSYRGSVPSGGGGG